MFRVSSLHADSKNPPVQKVQARGGDGKKKGSPWASRAKKKKLECPFLALLFWRALPILVIWGIWVCKDCTVQHALSQLAHIKHFLKRPVVGNNHNDLRGMKGAIAVLRVFRYCRT